MAELRVPFAVDNQERLCSPEKAEKAREYRCPACRDAVILRRGDVKVPHFAHKASEVCNAETIIHKTAKILIQNAVHEWKEGKCDPPLIRRLCRFCGKDTYQPLPAKVDSAVQEYRLANGSIVDVALMVGESAQAAVEVKVTHAVEAKKANSLAIRFIELEGNEVIEKPTIWRPIVDKFKKATCDNCKQTYAEFKARALLVAKENNVELTFGYYRYGLCKCWKCLRDIVVFGWPHNGLFEDATPRVKPVPRTIQCGLSGNARKYWVNICSFCQSIQDNFFMYAEPAGPFFAIEFTRDSEKAFETDMLRIALHDANGLFSERGTNRNREQGKNRNGFAAVTLSSAFIHHWLELK